MQAPTRSRPGRAPSRGACPRATAVPASSSSIETCRSRAAPSTWSAGGTTWRGWRWRTRAPTRACLASERALHLALELALLDRLALVADVLAPGQRDLDLRAWALEVQARRHQRQALLLGLADQPLDLALVHEQLARALGLMVLARRRPVGRDVDVVQPHLAVLDRGVAVLELRLAAAEGLDLGAREHEAGLPLVHQVVAVARLAIGGDVGHRRSTLADPDVRPHACALVTRERAVELVAAALEPAGPLAELAGERLGDADPREPEIVRILAADRELDHGMPSLQRRAREREVELGRLNEQPRGRRRRGREEHQRITAGRAIACGRIAAGSTPNQPPIRAPYSPRKSLVARRLPSGSSCVSPGNSPTIVPAARVPIRKPIPAAPWSVPEPFSCARRPNSDHTSVRTRSASPRASRSRWKASSESHVSWRFLPSDFAWSACVSYAPGAETDAQRIGMPAESIAANPASRFGNASVVCG